VSFFYFCLDFYNLINYIIITVGNFNFNERVLKMSLEFYHSIQQFTAIGMSIPILLIFLFYTWLTYLAFINDRGPTYPRILEKILNELDDEVVMLGNHYTNRCAQTIILIITIYAIAWAWPVLIGGVIIAAIVGAVYGFLYLSRFIVRSGKYFKNIDKVAHTHKETEFDKVDVLKHN
jgi:hypothetical protein